MELDLGPIIVVALVGTSPTTATRYKYHNMAGRGVSGYAKLHPVNGDKGVQ